LGSGKTVKFQVKFDIKQVDDGETDLKFKIFANTTSDDINPLEPALRRIAIVKKAEVSLTG